MKTAEKQSDKLRKELAQFVAKMQLEGIDIMTIKKPTDVGASIGNTTQKVVGSTS